MDVVHALADSPIGGGASAGVLAQQSGIMPIAVTLFTALAAVQFWRQAMPASEPAKSLVRCRFECNTLASMPPPPDLDPRRGNTPYWFEARRWARQVWAAEVLGQQAVDAAVAQDAAAQADAPSVDANVTRKRKKTAFDTRHSPPRSSTPASKWRRAPSRCRLRASSASQA